MKFPSFPKPLDFEALVTGEYWRRATERMRAKPAWVALVPLVALVFLVGWLDYSTGWEISLFIFYAVPILVAVWWAGSLAGAATAVSCGVTWWIANGPTNPYTTALGYNWAMVSRLFYFFMVVVAVAAVRRRQDTDAARIQMLEDHRQLEQDIVVISDHEQQRIGQDLHDGICQMLAAIGCATRILADDLRSRAIPEAEDADQIEESIQRTVLETRNLARGIFPVHVDRDGLSTALADLAKITSQLTGIPIDFNAPPGIDLDVPSDSMNLYRIAQEAVANAVRHGEATRISIQLLHDSDHLTLTIQDNGKGMGPAPPDRHKGMGLRVMRYRARCVNGDIQIRPGNDRGVFVSCQMPLNRCKKGSDG